MNNLLFTREELKELSRGLDYRNTHNALGCIAKDYMRDVELHDIYQEEAIVIHEDHMAKVAAKLKEVVSSVPVGSFVRASMYAPWWLKGRQPVNVEYMTSSEYTAHLATCDELRELIDFSVVQISLYRNGWKAFESQGISFMIDVDNGANGDNMRIIRIVGQYIREDGITDTFQLTMDINL